MKNRKLSSYLATIVSLLLLFCGISSLRVQAATHGLPNGDVRRKTRFSGEKQMLQMRNSVDAGDFYLTPEGPRKLRRSTDKVVIHGRKGQAPKHDVALAKASLVQFENAEEMAWGKNDSILTKRPATKEHAPAVKGKLTKPDAKSVKADLAALRLTAGIDVDPVFVDPDSGLLMVVESEIVICLKGGADAQAYFGDSWESVTPLIGTEDQFILAVENMSAEEILADCVLRSADTRIAWVEPNFRSEGVKHFTPNDANFSKQWYLKGGAAGGVDAEGAWDVTQGNGIVIAIIDDGVQTSHPDLQANIAPGKYNVLFGSANVEPVSSEDNHGTAVAGVAAAVGHNSIGVAGVSFRSKILPIKIAEGEMYATDTQLATAFRYAAGLTVGSGADIINFSWSWPQTMILNSALTAAATSGRGGKGCPIFISSGNDEDAWYYYEFYVSAGYHTFKFEYSKDHSVSRHQDCIWLDDVYIPGVGTQGFEGGMFPPLGWTTGGDAPWVQNVDRLYVRGTGTKSAKSGPISHSQKTYLQTGKTTSAGYMGFYLWTSTEEDYDVVNLYIDGVLQVPSGTSWSFTDPGGDYYFGGTGISYPASHASTIAVGASTDFNYRADYSQVGSGLDFVVSSSGGNNGIWTTDRTGAAGYSNGNYESGFGGTSSSSPLAAGIGALVLSVNPNLTASEVRGLLHKSCSKIGEVSYSGGDVGAGGWNTYYGYGKLMASKAVANTPKPSDILSPVHRFWSDQFGSHFYIMGDSERDRIANKYPGVWNYEDAAWYAYPGQAPGTEPVHRFWSDRLGKHFYIMGDSERDRIADKYQGIWRYEAVAWYAYPIPKPGTDPVGRFWSDAFMGHFYIITQSEINRIAGKYPGIWNYETVAYYAYPTLPSGKSSRMSDEAKAFAGNADDALSQKGNYKTRTSTAVSDMKNDASSRIDIVYPLTILDGQVSAYVYDSTTERWTCVLPATNSPAAAVLENAQPDCSYLLDVLAGDSGDEMTSVHQSAFTYQFDPPETIHEDSDAVAQENDVAVGSPIARIKTPAVDGPLTVKLYSSSQGVVKTLKEVPGGEAVELSIPEWNRWYWVGGWRDADGDGELVLSIWLRQERE